jgi:hypothetical protein
LQRPPPRVGFSISWSRPASKGMPEGRKRELSGNHSLSPFFAVFRARAGEQRRDDFRPCAFSLASPVAPGALAPSHAALASKREFTLPDFNLS